MKAASTNGSIDPQKEALVAHAGPVFRSNEQMRRNEMKREKRKQSIQESAKMSKLCWEQEFENFQADADRLSQETAALTNELRRISEECAKLTEENDSLMEIVYLKKLDLAMKQDYMEETYGHDAISDLKAVNPCGCSKDRSLQISSD